MDYAALKSLLKGKTMVAGTNEHGEDIIIQSYDHETDPYIVVTTSQSNGWLRENYYYKDGTLEESYRK